LLGKVAEGAGLNFSDYGISKFNPSTAQHPIKSDTFTSIGIIVSTKIKYKVIYS
jgi:hypothetical protein